MVVQHNLTAMNSNRMLGITTGTQAKSTEKLSSGYKINRAADDAAGLSISEKMRKQIRGLTQASLNAEDGISAVQTAEGALNEVQDMLQRMNELAVKAANGTMSENDRNYIQDEIDQLTTEIDRVSTTTKFNETYLLKGDEAAPKTTVYSYKVVNTEASFVAADTATKFYAAGDTQALTDSAIIAKLKNNEKIYTDSASVQADSLKEDDLVYQESSMANIKIDLSDWKVAGNSNDADSITLTIGLNTVTVDDGSAADGAAVAQTLNGDANFSTTYSATYDTQSHELIISALDSNVDSAAILADVTTVDIDGDDATVKGAITGENFVAEGVYDTADLTTVLDESAYAGIYYAAGGDELLDADAIKTALNKDTPDAIYTDSATPQTEAVEDDYTFTDSSSGKAVLYDSTGKALKASELAELAADSDVVLYTDSEATDSVTDISEYTESTEVNGALQLSLHVGADSTDDNQISVSIKAMSAAGLGLLTGAKEDGTKALLVNGTDDENARAAIDTIAAALQQVSTQRSALGAVQNRLEHTIANLDNVVENTTAAESQIRDTDMATEMVKYSNNNILAQAGQAMLAQANQANQGVLSLLG